MIPFDDAMVYVYNVLTEKKRTEWNVSRKGKERMKIVVICECWWKYLNEEKELMDRTVLVCTSSLQEQSVVELEVERCSDSRKYTHAHSTLYIARATSFSLCILSRIESELCPWSTHTHTMHASLCLSPSLHPRTEPPKRDFYHHNISHSIHISPPLFFHIKSHGLQSISSLFKSLCSLFFFTDLFTDFLLKWWASRFTL